jgi:hypothetical protein
VAELAHERIRKTITKCCWRLILPVSPVGTGRECSRYGVTTDVSLGRPKRRF